MALLPSTRRWAEPSSVRGSPARARRPWGRAAEPRPATGRQQVPPRQAMAAAPPAARGRSRGRWRAAGREGRFPEAAGGACGRCGAGPCCGRAGAAGRDGGDQEQWVTRCPCAACSGGTSRPWREAPGGRCRGRPGELASLPQAGGGLRPQPLLQGQRESSLLPSPVRDSPDGGGAALRPPPAPRGWGRSGRAGSGVAGCGFCPGPATGAALARRCGPPEAAWGAAGCDRKPLVVSGVFYPFTYRF